MKWRFVVFCFVAFLALALGSPHLPAPPQAGGAAAYQHATTTP